MGISNHPHLISGFRSFSQAASVAVILIGALVLVGWGWDIEPLKSVIPGKTAMNPGGTALAFLLAGVSLLVLSASDPRRFRSLGMACAGIVVGLALLRLGGYLGGWDGGPDQFLFRGKLDQEALYTGHPNRMAPNTAAALLLVGLALLLLDARSRRG